MILNRNDALYAAEQYINYFESLNRIDDYLRRVKLERMSKLPFSLPGFGEEEDFFNSFDMHPRDMNFRVDITNSKTFHNYLEITSSHAVEKSIPGKGVLLTVRETNTNKIVGMIRLGSPTINSKPRNEFLGKPLRSTDMDVMRRFNNSVIMGFIIVPTQPFGFNYLGGKLLASICCSHEVRELVNKKYGSNICLFETTSLYGTTKSSSQYDGMKPFLRYIGLTDSNFTPMINDDTYRTLYRWFVDKNDGEHLVHQDATSKKMKRTSKMISIIKNSLKTHDDVQYKKFVAAIEGANSLTEQKRTYISTYGYDKVADYLNLERDDLEKKENFDRYYMDNILDWWKNKAGNRYDSILKDGRLRTKLETWNTNPEEIDIIR